MSVSGVHKQMHQTRISQFHQPIYFFKVLNHSPHVIVISVYHFIISCYFSYHIQSLCYFLPLLIRIIWTVKNVS